MKNRTVFVGAILSLIPLVQPLMIKTGIALSTVGLTTFVSEKVNAEFRNVDRFFKIYNKRIDEGDYEGAVSIMKKLISQFPKFAPAYYQKGYINTFYLNKHEQAVSDFTRAISLNKGGKSDLILFLWMRGFAKQQMSNIQGACIDWQEVRRLGDKEVINELNLYCD